MWVAVAYTLHFDLEYKELTKLKKMFFVFVRDYKGRNDVREYITLLYWKYKGFPYVGPTPLTVKSVACISVFCEYFIERRQEQFLSVAEKVLDAVNSVTVPYGCGE